MSSIPRDAPFDSTLDLLADGYDFMAKRRRQLHSDIFTTRLLLQDVVCLVGPEAARLFYEDDRITRRGAMPITTLTLLQDFGSVQMLDGAAHRCRKAMFMSLMSPDGIQRLVDIAADRWRERIPVWAGRDRVTLFPALQGLYCRAVCDWAGLPLDDDEARQRTREFAAMIEGAGSIGPRNWRGQVLRWRSERWARDVIEQIRDGSRPAPEGSAVHVFATHRDLDDRLLDPKIAAVELINLLRATTAVARFVTFEALALHDHPEWRERLRGAADDEIERFVQEVRRFYPFFPFIGERVLVDLEWQGHHFAEGAWLALDLDGTDHDARLWDDPESFRPERFLTWDRSLFNFVPQGGDNHYRSHRCPGEWITIALMKDAARWLTAGMTYSTPPQDLSIDRMRMPTIPHSRFVIDHVRRIDAPAD